MQHERNKKRVEHEADEPSDFDRSDAIELLAIEVAKRRARRPDDDHWTISLPRLIWELIIASARDGLHKGAGRSRPKDTHGDKARKQSIIAGARTHKDRLVKTGVTANQAELKASEEASRLAKERYDFNLAPSTIRDRMKRSSK